MLKVLTMWKHTNWGFVPDWRFFPRRCREDSKTQETCLLAYSSAHSYSYKRTIAANMATSDPYKYYEGFGNHFVSEAIPGSLPKGRLDNKLSSHALITLQSRTCRTKHAAKVSAWSLCGAAFWNCIHCAPHSQSEEVRVRDYYLTCYSHSLTHSSTFIYQLALSHPTFRGPHSI